MTKTNFKYGSSGAGTTLFKPQKESEEYKPFDIQRASEPILAAMRDNAKVAVGNVKRTGDRFLNTKRIEHANEEATARHNAEIATINDAIKVEQFSKISPAAQNIVTAGIQIHQRNKAREGTALALKMSVEHAEKYKEYLKNKDIFLKEIRTAAEEKFVVGWVQSFGDDIQVAHSFLDASGLVKKAMNEKLKGQIIQSLPQRWNDYLLNTTPTLRQFGQQLKGQDKIKFEEDIQAGVLHATVLDAPLNYQQLHDELDNIYKGQNITWLGGIDSVWRSKATGALVSELSDSGFDTDTILTEFKPVIDLARDKGALEAHQYQKKQLQNQLSDLKYGSIRSTFDRSLGQSSNFGAQEFDQMVQHRWQTYGDDTMTETARRSLAKKDILESIIKLYEEGHPSVNSVEIETLLSGLLTRGNSTASFRKLWGPELQELDFENKIEAFKLKKFGYEKATLANKKKAFIAAAADHVKKYGPLSTVQAQAYAKAGAEKGYGVEKDLLLELTQKMATDLGLSIDEWVGKIQRDYKVLGSKLKRSDYISLGVPIQALEHEDTKNLFEEKETHVITFAKRKTIEDQLSKAYAGLHNNWKGLTGSQGRARTIQEQWAGQNIYDKYFTKAWADRVLRHKNDSLSQDELIREATNDVNELLLNPANRENLEGRPTTLEERAKFRKKISEERRSSPTGRLDGIVLSPLVPRLKYLAQVKDTFDKNGGQGDFLDTIDLGFLWPDPSQGGKLVPFFDDYLNDAAKHTKSGGVMNFIRLQAKAYKIQGMDKVTPLPTANTEYHQSFYETPEWVTEGLLNLTKHFEPSQKQPERRTALGNTVQEKDAKGKWKPVYKANGKPLIMDPSKLNKTFNEQDPRYFFTEGLGIDSEKFEARLNEMGTTTSDYFGTFLKQHGIKGADLFEPIKMAQMLKILYNYFGDEIWPEGTFTRPEEEDPWMPPAVPTIFEFYRGVA